MLVVVFLIHFPILFIKQHYMHQNYVEIFVCFIILLSGYKMTIYFQLFRETRK